MNKIANKLNKSMQSNLATIRMRQIDFSNRLISGTNNPVPNQSIKTIRPISVPY